MDDEGLTLLHQLFDTLGDQLGDLGEHYNLEQRVGEDELHERLTAYLAANPLPAGARAQVPETPLRDLIKSQARELRPSKPSNIHDVKEL